MALPARTAAVIIGRNEGERLLRCLASMVGTVDWTIYVDSGSTDGSVAAARAAGAEVIELDLSVPFTAARARNAGIEALRAGKPPVYVQFIDGDCEMRPGWLDAGVAFLQEHATVAVASGRLHERYPEASLYNALCDREWDTPVGPAKACGGIALIRWSALDEVGGYNPSLIAGEEPEMCVRLRQKGWEIWRLDAGMALHDAAMTRFSQWWKRTRRGGYAAAEGMAMHGRAPEYHGVRAVIRALSWGAVLPLAILVLSLAVSPWALLLLLAYPAQVGRIALRDGGTRAAWESAIFLMLGKFAEVAGVAEYVVGRWSGRRRGIIEYK